MNEARRYGYLFSVGWGALVLGGMWLVAESVATVFSTEPGVLQEIMRYLWIMPFGYALYGVLNVSEETLNAVGRPMVAALQTLIHMFVFYAPLALIGAYLLGFAGLLWGVTVANCWGERWLTVCRNPSACAAPDPSHQAATCLPVGDSQVDAIKIRCFHSCPLSGYTTTSRKTTAPFRSRICSATSTVRPSQRKSRIP